MPAKKTPPPLYQLKVTLLDIKPPIWRRIHVPSTIKLCCLHDVLQEAMGWTHSHLHLFEKSRQLWGDPKWNEDQDQLDEGKAKLSDLLEVKGESLYYDYDFGDGWRHKVVLEKIIPVNEIVKTAFCLAGKRRCPPEDVGGPPGYADFLEAIFDPTHEDFERLITWFGGPFHAEEFNTMAVNDTLSQMKLPIRHESS
jgi:hypothetical protein